MRFKFIFIVLVLALSSCALKNHPSAYYGIKPKAIDGDTSSVAERYAKFDLVGDRLLVFRDIPGFVSEYVKGKSSLDYGCGAGHSTRFLHSLGLNVTGVDNSENMLAQARAAHDGLTYKHIDSAKIPSTDKTYDLVFSSLVLFDVPTKEENIRILTDINRALKDDGIFIAVIGSEDMYSQEWLSLDANFPENKNLKSGDVAKIRLKDIDVTFNDFYYTDKDYREMFTKAGLEVIKMHHPLGKASDGYTWKSETKLSPYVVYVTKKKNS